MIILGVPVLDRYDLLGRLLMSVYRSSVQPDRIVIIDNGKKFRETNLGLSDRCELVEPGRNLGFSGACNTILDRALELGAERIVVSNDDIELNDPNALGQVLACDVDLVRAPGYSFFALRTNTIEKIGWFDEAYWPGYHEDIDHHRRLVLAGLSYADPQGLGISHVGSATIHSWSKKRQERFGQRFMELQAYYAEKWGGPMGSEVFKKPFDGQPPPGWSERPITRGGLRPAEPWRTVA